MHMRRGVGLIMLAVSAGGFARADDSREEFFEAKVRPVLVQHCVQCHGEKKASAGLRLDSRQAVVRGGESGAAVVPGRADASLLIEAVRHENSDLKMPPDGKLAPDAISALTRWVADGAVWP